MTEKKDYLMQTLENGSIQISEEVVASISALAVREVEGVYGLSTSKSLDTAKILSRRNLRRGIRVVLTDTKMSIGCNLVVKMGAAVMEVAKNVQQAISDEVFTMTGVRPTRVNVNVCGVVVPKSVNK